MDNSLITARDFRNLAGISERTELDWRHKGIAPPFVRVGPRLVCYRKADIEAWLRAHTHQHLAAEAAANVAA